MDARLLAGLAIAELLADDQRVTVGDGQSDKLIDLLLGNVSIAITVGTTEQGSDPILPEGLVKIANALPDTLDCEEDIPIGTEATKALKNICLRDCVQPTDEAFVKVLV